jgi:hypothetical protein
VADHALFIRIGNGPALQSVHAFKCALQGWPHSLQKFLVETHPACIEGKSKGWDTAKILSMAIPEVRGGHGDDLFFN